MTRFLPPLLLLLASSYCSDSSARSKNSSPPPYQRVITNPAIHHVQCPEGTTQKQDSDLPTHHIQIWCVDEDDLRHGPDMTWYANGQLFVENHYNHGKEDGIQRDWHENGTLAAETPQVNGLAHGTCREWYPNGKPKSHIEMKDDHPTGVAQLWDDQGHLTETIDYNHLDKDGKPTHRTFRH
jgi:antitoxin component YwqK of YwqJK toxin-antitoxin module